MRFGMTLTNMFVAFITCGWLPASSRGIDDAGRGEAEMGLRSLDTLNRFHDANRRRTWR